MWWFLAGAVFAAIGGGSSAAAASHGGHHEQGAAASSEGAAEIGTQEDDTSEGDTATTSGEPKVSTASLSKEDVRRRNIEFGFIFGGGCALLGFLGIAAAYKKQKKLKVGYMEVNEHLQLVWNGQVLSKASYAALKEEVHVTDVTDVEVQHQVEAPKDADGPPVELTNAQKAKNDEALEQAQQKAVESEIAARKANEAWMRRRSFLLGSLFCVYVGASIGIPFWKANTVSCDNGFFWEDHLPFFGILLITKCVELWLYVFDDTIRGHIDFVPFVMKFGPSMLAYLDGYTDATSIVIAHSCDSEIAQNISTWMAGSYLVGVVVCQWMIVLFLATRDESQACLMKLIHFDAVSALISLTDEASESKCFSSKTIWFIVNMARTFGEDIPQAILQTLFLIYVKKNYFMILSVCVSIASSMKALHDAITRKSFAEGLTAEGIVDETQTWDHANNTYRDELEIDGGIIKCPNMRRDYINVFTKLPMRSGVHYFHFIMHHYCDEQWCGITAELAQQCSGHSLKAWSYYAGGSLCVDGQNVKAFAKLKPSGDVIGMLVDVDQGAVAFQLNGELQGASRVPKGTPLWVVTHVDTPRDHVELVRLDGAMAPPSVVSALQAAWSGLQAQV